MTAFKEGTSGMKQRTAWIISNGRETRKEELWEVWEFIVAVCLTGAGVFFFFDGKDEQWGLQILEVT